jgi:hypothetical protein
MKTRIDALCDLVGLKTTKPVQISDRIIEEKNEIINDTHTEHHSLPVAFAVQTGSFENVRFLIEDIQVLLHSNVEITYYNVLQWAHDPRADGEVKSYLSDLNKKLWYQFQDGTGDLHIFAYKGMTAEVEAILAQDPDRVCELARKRYSPLYWAYLGGQKDMQTLLLLKLKEYKQRHVHDNEKMLTFHIGMLYATTQNVESYADFKKFLRLGKRAGDYKSVINFDQILRFYLFDAEVILTYQHEALEKAKEENQEILQKLEKQQIFERCQSIFKQAMRANEAISKRTKKDDHELIDLIYLDIQYLEFSSLHYLSMFTIEMTAIEKNWSLVEKYLNASYSDAEAGILLIDNLPKIELGKKLTTLKNDFIKTFKATQVSAEKEEKSVSNQNEAVKIKREPLKQLFQMIQKKEKTSKEIMDFIATNSIDVAKFYRYRAAIDHAVLHGTQRVVSQLLAHYPEALAIPAGSKRKNLMHVIRGRKEVSPEIKDLVLNPKSRLWELFQDGTTDLHMHAFAGRVDEVITLLIEKPDRNLEVNRAGENVFYWAFKGDARDMFINEMSIADTYKLSLVDAGRWDDLIKYYQSSRKFFKECFTQTECIELVKSNLDWLKELEGHNNAPGYIVVYDHLCVMLAQAYLENYGREGILYQLDLIQALEIVATVTNTTLRVELEYELIHEFIRSAINEAITYRDEGDSLSSQLHFDDAKLSFSAALESLNNANNRLVYLPDDLCGKTLAALQIKDLSAEVNAKLEALVEFLPLDPDLDFKIKDKSSAAAPFAADSNLKFSVVSNVSYSSLISSSIFSPSSTNAEDKLEEEDKKTVEAKSEPPTQPHPQSRPTF